MTAFAQLLGEQHQLDRASDRLAKVVKLANAEQAKDGVVNVITQHRLLKAHTDVIAASVPSARRQVAIAGARA